MGLAALLAARPPKPSPGGTRSTIAEGITRRQCTRRGNDQRVQRNPVTLVTPTIRYLALSLSHGQQRARGGERNRESVPAPDIDGTRDGRARAPGRTLEEVGSPSSPGARNHAPGAALSPRGPRAHDQAGHEQGHEDDVVGDVGCGAGPDADDDCDDANQRPEKGEALS